MLSLQSQTSPRWMEQVDQHLAEVLIDHAHCERKAAGSAMTLLSAYVDNVRLCNEMIVIINEELEHFQLVLDVLKRRNIPFRRQQPSSYGRKLHLLVRKKEPQRAVDRLLIAGLIEARSCERFDILRKQISDPELAQFYDNLFESEARHYSTYVQLARDYADEITVQSRLMELANAEAEIIEQGDPLPRMHS